MITLQEIVANFMDRYIQKLEVSLLLLENEAAFLKNQSLHFIYQEISRLFITCRRHKGKSIVALGSWQRKFVRRKLPKVAKAMVFKINKITCFKTACWNSHIMVLINNFAIFEHLSIPIFGGLFLHWKLTDRKSEKVEKFSIFPDNQTFCSPQPLVVFRPIGYLWTLFYS